MAILSAPGILPEAPGARVLWLIAAAALPLAAVLHAVQHGWIWPAGAATLGLGSAAMAAVAARRAMPLLQGRASSARDELARRRAAPTKAVAPVVAALVRIASGSEKLASVLTECAARAASALMVARTALEAGQKADAASRALNSSLREAEEMILSTRKIVADARHKTEETERLIVGLVTRASEIGEIVTMIENLASQTHLAALNAAIESARAKPTAGELSPVAQEFKLVAQQTARAARRLSEQAGAMKQAGHAAAEAISVLRFGVAQADELAESTFKAARARLRVSDDMARDACDSAASARATFAYVDAIDAGLKLALVTAEETRERAMEAKQRADRLSEIVEAAVVERAR